MAQLRRENIFRLQRSLFYWDKSFDAPFVNLIYKKLYAYIENKFPEFNWEKELRLAREDFSHVVNWGPLNTEIDGARVLLNIKGHKVFITLSKLMWCLVYPDYLLITYPTWPPGKQKTMDAEARNWANPMYHYPSRFWHLPDSVYTYFETVYGERNPEDIKSNNYHHYIVKREEYCRYFTRKYKLPKDHFSSVTGSRVQAMHRDLQTILSID